MGMDCRDKPRISFDQNGDALYTTEDGHAIRGVDPNSGKDLQKLEELLSFYQQFPMGMK